MLSYQTIGDPSHTPLIFIHGLGASSDQIISSFPDLKGIHLIAPDMPGHRQSQDYPIENLNFDSFADQVIELMDQLNIGSLNIGGLSMGSGITLNLALRYPERVKRIILLRPSWLDQQQPEHLKLVAYTGQWIEELGVNAAREKLFADLDFQQLNKENPPVANSITALFSRPTTAASTAVLYKMWQDSPFADLTELSTICNPTLLLTTTQDELHPQSTADALAANLNHVQQAVLPPRHHEYETYVQALNSAVLNFLTG